MNLCISLLKKTKNKNNIFFSQQLFICVISPYQFQNGKNCGTKWIIKPPNTFWGSTVRGLWISAAPSWPTELWGPGCKLTYNLDPIVHPIVRIVFDYDFISKKTDIFTRLAIPINDQANLISSDGRPDLSRALSCPTIKAEIWNPGCMLTHRKVFSL